MAREIALDQVTYTYPSRDIAALDTVSLVIPKGAKVGVTGATGAGKSTLIDVILGLLTPASGRLLVDGTAITGERRRAWQRQVAHVPQSIFLSDDTVAANIAFGLAAAEIDLDRVRWAAAAAMVLPEIEALPRGFMTLVGENGAMLSGGQRQRIGIARALYKGGAVLVLDEATNALDPDTERRVIASLAGLPERPTLLIISHRASALADCDLIVRMTGDGGLEVER